MFAETSSRLAYQLEGHNHKPCLGNLPRSGLAPLQQILRAIPAGESDRVARGVLATSGPRDDIEEQLGQALRRGRNIVSVFWFS